MKIQNIFFFCCSMLISIQVNAQGIKKENNTSGKPTLEITKTRLTNQVSELMADRVSPTKVATDELAVAKLESYNEQLAEENTMFPADELYNSNWDTLHVNPFAKSNISFPDSYTIDCRGFCMPIDNNKVRVTSKYGPRRRRMHRGIDLDLNVGDTVRAAFNGKVRIKSYERRGYGYYLVIRHPNGLETVYGHLSKFLVRENQIVHEGQAIALGGNTGRSTGSHLHFETRFLGKDFNPAEIIDFAHGGPYKDQYVFHNVKIKNRKTNVYSASLSNDATGIHKVKKGETLGRIANKYGTTVNALCKLNGISRKSTLSIGQSIRVKSQQITIEADTPPIKQTTTTTKSASKEKSKPIASSKTNKKIEVPIETASAKTTNQNEPVYHKIQSGDTLYSVAKKYGVTVEKLCEINNMKENTIIRIGQKIRCS